MSKKVVIITGGTRGIGLGISRRFHHEGYCVVINYREDDAQAKLVGAELDSENVLFVKADVSVEKDRRDLLERAIESFGCPDVLVNNAGVIRLGRFLEVDENTFDFVMKTNLYGPMFLGQAFARELVRQNKSGSIINICTMGTYGPGNVSYCTSKAALYYLTTVMAKELAKKKIRVNSVSPGMVATDLNVEVRENNPEAWQKMLDKVPLKRAGQPEDIASAVYYLASDEASYITGRDFVVDGGYLLR